MYVYIKKKVLFLQNFFYLLKLLYFKWHVAVGMLAQFVEIPQGATNTFNKDGNKAPYEWCQACSKVPDAAQYCAAKLP